MSFEDIVKRRFEEHGYTPRKEREREKIRVKAEREKKVSDFLKAQKRQPSDAVIREEFGISAQKQTTTELLSVEYEHPTKYKEETTVTAVLIILELILITFLVMFGSITLKKHFENKKSTKNTNTDSRKKLKRINVPKIVKTVLIGIMYVLAIALQMSKFTPYVTTQTYISAQNVPHTITVDRGYSSFDYAHGSAVTGEKNTILTWHINYPIAALQFSLTTAIAVLAYYFWCCKKPVNIPITDDNTNGDILKKQNIQLQQTIDKLVDQNNKIELENRALKEQIMNIYNALPKMDKINKF